MRCEACDASVPEGANYCPSCGAAVAVSAGSDNTTASIEIGELDPHHVVEEVPEMAPGTGMLVVVRGPNAGSRFLLDHETTTVGRHPDSAIFLDDVTVSRRHAELLQADLGITLQDLGSLNGTYVNGERVDERQLGTGDELQVGRFKLLYLGSPGLTAIPES